MPQVGNRRFPYTEAGRRQAKRFARGINKKNPAEKFGAKRPRRNQYMSEFEFSASDYSDILEFAMQPGIDPNLVQNLISEAARIQQEGQTKIVISQQLFQQIQAALQNYNIQKQQVDGMTVDRIQQHGLEAGSKLVEFYNKDDLTTIDERKDKINAARRWKRRGLWATGAGGASTLAAISRYPARFHLRHANLLRGGLGLTAGGLGTAAAAKLYERHQQKKIKQRRRRNYERKGQ